MAREKEGLDYFPFDVHFNDEMKLIKAEYGLKAVGLFAILLQKIYGGRGYYAPWDSDVELMFASVNGVGVNFVREVVSATLLDHERNNESNRISHSLEFKITIKVSNSTISSTLNDYRSTNYGFTCTVLNYTGSCFTLLCDLHVVSTS